MHRSCFASTSQFSTGKFECESAPTARSAALLLCEGWLRHAMQLHRNHLASVSLSAVQKAISVMAFHRGGDNGRGQSRAVGVYQSCYAESCRISRE